VTPLEQAAAAEDGTPRTRQAAPHVVGPADALPVVELGADFRTIPLDALEHLAVAHRDVYSSLRRVLGEGVNEATLLVTCHRVELYAALERTDTGEATARLAELVQPLEGPLQPLTVRTGQSVVSHLVSVAAGLESAVLGEGEILGQVRRAAEAARKANAAGPVLDRLFQHAIRHGRAIRGRLGLLRSDRSLSKLALDLLTAKRNPTELAGVGVIGTGEVAADVLERLSEADVSRLAVVSRKPARAAAIGEGFGAEPRGLADLPRIASEVDVLVLATAATSPVLRPGHLAARNSSEPLLVIDLGVPRNADGRIAELPAVELVDIASLIEVADTGAKRDSLLEEIEAQLAEAAEEFAEWHRCTQIGPVLAELRRRYEQIILDETLRNLPPTLASDLQGRARQLANRLAGKLLHQPLVGLKEIAVEESTDKAEELGRKLFLAGADHRG
jgi:glutamyl-tRNA reductase